MSRKIFVALTLSLLTIAALTGTVLAATLTPFTASGDLAQTGSGRTVAAPLSAARFFVPADLYGQLEGLLPAGGLTPGELTFGQKFSGVVSNTDWPTLNGESIRVRQNSWFTADVEALVNGAPAVPGVGLAWGIFNVGGWRDAVTGSYAAFIQGLVSINPACYDETTNPYALQIQIQDQGGWKVLIATGDLRAIERSGGALNVLASGCLRSEAAQFTLTGAYTPEANGNGRRGGWGNGNGNGNNGNGNEAGGFGNRNWGNLPSLSWGGFNWGSRTWGDDD
jgi:hypothetical protein